MKSENKIDKKIASETLSLQAPLAKDSLAIYVHYPFCKSKCPYCDFNSHIHNKIDHAAFLKAYETELEFFAQSLKNRKITSIFFGGGTPSLMPSTMTAKILEKIAYLWPLDCNCEITLEANPTSVESQKFAELKNCGINRLSLGVQSLNDGDLKFLGREHSAKDAILAIEAAKRFFTNFSFDLIYARPSQSVSAWINELKVALDFQSQHLSLYQLTIEKGTKFFSEYRLGKFELPCEEIAAELYESTNNLTAAAGFENYEISNYGKQNFRCRHNLQYWQGGEYLGIGAGAHSRLFLEPEIIDCFNSIKTRLQSEAKGNSPKPRIDLGLQFENKSKTNLEKYGIIMLHEPLSWLHQVEQKKIGIQSFAKINQQELIEELILMGLRLKDGIFEEIFVEQVNKNFEQIFDQKKLLNLQRQGLIEVMEDEINSQKIKIKIPESKRILTNSIITKLCASMI